LIGNGPGNLLGLSTGIAHVPILFGT
jgi:hypothetical protein